MFVQRKNLVKLKMYTETLSIYDLLIRKRQFNKNNLKHHNVSDSENCFVNKGLSFIDIILGTSSFHGLIHLRRPQRHYSEQYVKTSYTKQNAFVCKHNSNLCTKYEIITNTF